MKRNKRKTSLKRALKLGLVMSVIGVPLVLGSFLGYYYKQQQDLVGFTSRRRFLTGGYNGKKKLEFVNQGDKITRSKSFQPLCTLFLYDCAALCAVDKKKHGIYHVHNTYTSKEDIGDWLVEEFDRESLRLYVMDGSQQPSWNQDLMHFTRRITHPTTIMKIYDVLEDMDLVDRTEYINSNSKLIGFRPSTYNVKGGTIMAYYKDIGSSIALDNGRVMNTPRDHGRIFIDKNKFMEGEFKDCTFMAMPLPSKLLK